MHLTRIPAPPGAVDALKAETRGLFDRDFPLPGDADLTPLLPESGGVPVYWVTAHGHTSLDRGVVLYVHGGGFQSRMPELMNLFAHRLAGATSRPVLVVHYRLVPADPYPAPLDDVLAVYRSLLDQGVPAGRITVVGESSGGALTLSALLALKEQGIALPASVVTLSAVTDMTVSGASVDTNSATDSGIDRAMLGHLIGQYLGAARPDQAPQSPLHGALDGLPPLLLTAGGAEALLDDTLRFGAAASAAGGEVEVDIYEEMPHGFQLRTLFEENPTGRGLLDRISTWVEKHTV
ncbi:alpha/beta hydrolase fold domain-containing protein [Sinosporangium siamense]|uniref:Alpha/beta hydrolase fold-3 domain-containing protein n=1 Tax=Sinosporangium siamense TaxID=1367973 RepID=A0A919RI68_9ACTN|nr:alpha/beta hydrolase [Sinosporangium siamense]GII94345.1 hypothetical protein Ssi02_45760 [Sinosporangium siamense]